MGGIPYQSPGCLACKKRKIKCDLQEPECDRCIKRGVSCPGFDKDRLFVNNASVRQRQRQRKVSERKESPATQLVRPSILSRTVASGPEVRMQLFSSFMNAYFPLNTAGATEVDAWYYLVSNFSTLPNRSELLDRAISSMSAICLAKINRDDQLLRQGLELQNGAMRKLGGLIQRNTMTDELLYTLVIFQTLATIDCPGGVEAWFAHTKGLNTLLKQAFSRTSGTSLSPLVKAIYNKKQKLTFILSVTISRPNVEEYQYLTHSDNDTNTPLDGLFTLFMGIASLINRQHSLEYFDYEGHQHLLKDSLVHRDAILSWYMLEQVNIGGPPSIHAGEPLSTGLGITDHLFGPAYTFTSLDNARLHILLWAGLVSMNLLISEIQTAISSHPNNTATIAPVFNEQRAVLEYFADQICRAIPYFLQGSMRLWGAHSVVGSMTQLCKAYSHTRSQARFLWCHQHFQLIADRGFEAARHLGALSWNEWSRLNLSSMPSSITDASLDARFLDDFPEPVPIPGETPSDTLGETTNDSDGDLIAEVTTDHGVVSSLVLRNAMTAGDEYFERRAESTRITEREARTG
ncbi:uncharacterized protein N7459_005481 [Penicillium hispanicum]|uniref:uncharacterized protein n=1 Tax=Penicillium hispanicum TaxID=1080232 RepID=UPI00253F6D62|nr:uncharacterized protein N7459_005481 [Penicillium hispanicum]KAJ5579496.1 hypothetical protein N7459_005481 [Penicillium hispanicum]